MAKVLVTGAAGFIGSSLVRELCKQGHEVSGIDNLVTGNMDNLSGTLGDIDFCEGDVRDGKLIHNMCRNIDIVFHEAALPSVPKSVLDPVASHQANVDGTFSLLMAARENGVRRIVYAASSSAYGESPTLPKHEDMPTAPISPYAVQKLTGELYMQSFARVYPIETVCLRYFNVFGPHQAADSPYSGVLAKFITAMLAGNSAAIYGDGSQSRDFTYIDNVVQANLSAAFAPTMDVNGKVYNIACGENHSLLDTYYTLAHLIGFEGDPLFAPTRVGDIQHSLAAIEKANRDFGYVPTVGFVEGLSRTVDWYANRLGVASQFVSTAL
ncbi:MAG TPA: SDR family oxidoreductase [Silvibacterium sp.]|nr:SDR family oxidoreductase [Silvibacterium sp.]